ncbi:Major facilitator superfamily transporter [Tolypocladium paradoxum]|uniref:Major facilitator superfamily transporter n=1 Tax=Tolypocladium paradoxum TaxID=94208 RepID=A0A2S4KQJ2_9HYPO|nr:Major facilitator superfamily transporter [Tolypocladium paradoxum]
MAAQPQIFGSDKEACPGASPSLRGPEAEHQAAGHDASTTTTVPQTSAGTDTRAVSVFSRNVILAALGLAVFVSSLDATIVATLVPTLTDEFRSVNSVGWYGTAYLLVSGATQPSWGKLYATFRPKLVFLVSLALLEAGSLICALAKNSPTFIGGRAVAGLGSAGIIAGALIITALVVPLHLRPIYMGVIGSLEGVSLVTGPVIGGAIVDRIGWRWAFWINLPIGAALGAALVLLFHPPRSASNTTAQQSKTILYRLKQIDVLGGMAIAGSLTCLFLALEWGGSDYAWSSGRIIALLVVFGVSFTLVGVHQYWRGDEATFPVRLLKNTSFVGWLVGGFCFSSAQYVVLFYLPLWFQAVNGLSPLQSGIQTLAMVIPVICVALAAGAGVSAVGYLAPFMMAATILTCVGAGLLYTLTPGIAQAPLVGYQILFGSGSGMGVQQAIVGSQADLDSSDAAYGTSAIMLVNTIGGAIFICVSQNIFMSDITRLADVLPGVNKNTLGSGFESVRKKLSPEELEVVINGYNHGIQRVFLMVLVLCCLTVLIWPLLKWKSIKPEAKDGKNTTR